MCSTEVGKDFQVETVENRFEMSFKNYIIEKRCVSIFPVFFLFLFCICFSFPASNYVGIAPQHTGVNIFGICVSFYDLKVNCLSSV